MTRLVRRLAVVVAVLAAATLAAATAALADTPQNDVAAIATTVDDALASLAAGDVSGARAAYQRFDEGWGRVEDGVRAASRPSYRAIEDAMGDVKAALVKTDNVDRARATTALTKLRAELDAFVRGSYAPSSATPRVSLGGVVARLNDAIAAIDRGDTAAASAAMAVFREEWPDVEGLVKVRSAEAYATTEDDMGAAIALLGRGDAAAARAAIERMSVRLAPFAGSEARYGVFDAAVILVREGLEALLVVGALLAFLSKTGNARKAVWIWGGAGVGIALSVAVAVVISLVFTSGAIGSDRELLEGIVGLVAAVLLVYMSWWLHSKASLASWQRYIQEKATSALARNSLVSLATISFLAVFREGAETVLFYAGIAPAISVGDLAMGLGVGTAALAAIGVAMLAFSLRLPIKLFFSVASVLIYYLAFKFIGTGIHALQVAGITPATPAPLPGNGFLGVFPTWETTVPQVVLLVAAAAVVLVPRLRMSQPRTPGSAAAA